MGIGVIAPAEDACIWNIRWEEVTEPVDIVRCPGLFTVSVESMNGNDTIFEQ